MQQGFNFFNQAQQQYQQQQPQVTNYGMAMKEISVAPRDLVDMDAQTYNEIRAHGRNVSEVK